MKISGQNKLKYRCKGQPIWGLHSVGAILDQKKRKIYGLMVANAHLKERWPQADYVERSVLESLLPEGAVHQGVVVWTQETLAASLDDLCPSRGNVLVMDGIVDPQNLGALWRSAAAFGVQAVVLSRNGTPALEGTVAKVACGALEHVPPIWVGNVAQSLVALKRQGFFCVGLAEEGGGVLEKCDLWPVGIVIGSEGKGLKRLVRERCDLLCSISTSQAFSTLNASVAGALALSHFWQLKPAS